MSFIWMLLAACLGLLNGPLVDTSAGADQWPLRVTPYTYEDTATTYTVVPVLREDGVQGYQCRRTLADETPMVKYIAEYRAYGGTVYEDGSCNETAYGDGMIVITLPAQPQP